MAQRISASNSWRDLVNKGGEQSVVGAHLHAEVIDFIEQGTDERLVQFEVIVRVFGVASLFVLCSRCSEGYSGTSLRELSPSKTSSKASL